MLDNIYKVWNTVRYMTSRQWKYRLYYTARNRLSKRYPHSIDHPVQPRVSPGCYAVDIGNEDISLADGILNNEIPTVSGRKVLFCGDWDLHGEEYRLVSFKLNAFRWLLDLSDAFKATGDRKYIEKGFEFINDWTCKCGHVISGDKWNPYVIAERIANWIGFCSQYGENTLDRYAEIIYPQAAELASSLEYQLGANHLLSEAKALICAGVFLEDEQFYQTGKSLLIKEVEEQFLPDGGHYERSVSYHVESLQQLFESWVLLKGRNDPDATRFVEYMKAPYQFLNGMIGKNGAIPLFNDAAYDYPFYDAADFLATASYVFSVMPPNAKHGNYSKRWSWLGTGSADITWERKTIYPDTGLVHYPFEVGSEKYSFYMRFLLPPTGGSVCRQWVETEEKL